jgi:hypothetical protein
MTTKPFGIGLWTVRVDRLGTRIPTVTVAKMCSKSGHECEPHTRPSELVIRLRAAGVSEMGRLRKGHGEDIAADKRVQIYPHTEAEARGVIVEDFGDTAGYGVDIGTHHIANPARRWAVQLDNGELVFVNSADLVVDG